jgi:2-pyrone-4,6-dicarboxylate lactonase
MLPIIHTLIDAAPDLVVWATDWPHPVSTSQPPNEADLLELLYRAVPDTAMLKKSWSTIPANYLDSPHETCFF